MDWSRGTLSPNLYGNAGSFDIADATADFRKSMSDPSKLHIASCCDK